MFINKISGGSGLNNNTFKGFQYVKNEYGKTIHYFYYPFDGQYRDAYLEFYKVKEAPDEFQGYTIVQEAGVKRIPLDRRTLGKAVDLDTIFDDLAPGEELAYQIQVQHEAPKADTGIQFDAKKIKDGKETWETFTLLPRATTTPMAKNGLGYLSMVDIHKPGARYEGFKSDRTGSIVYDERRQFEAEQIKRNSSNKIGGSLAGVEHDIPNLREKGITTLFLTPIAGRDTLYYHRYHNQNNFQMADEVGNIENFESFVTSLFKHGMTYVFDGTFTSEGSEGADVQYALRWSQENPDALYRFRFHNINDAPVGFGIIPKNKENTRYKLVNSPYILAKDNSGKVKVIENENYKKGKPTYFQLYDITFVTEEQAKSDELITAYTSQITDKIDKLAVNTYQDVTVPQKNQIFNLRDFKITLENAANFINSTDGPKEINTPEVAMLVGQTAEFEFAQKSKNAALWENKEGLFTRNHGFSGNDEKILMSKPEGPEREQLRSRIERGAAQNIDEDIQVASYWTGLYRDIIVSYIARTLDGAKTVDDIEELIKAKKLPEEIRLSAKALENIENGNYFLEPKGELERDEATIRALMNLPMPALDFADNTVSVLKQGFFFNRASQNELIGKTRYELDLMGNPQLSDIERNVYEKTNKLFKHDIKNFADAVIDKMDSQLKERLIDADGEYTEFGEYLIEHIGPQIAKYAFLKSLIGDNFIGQYTKTMPDGSIKYDYEEIKNVTSLEDLGIPANSMVSNATALQHKMQEGMKKLNNNDVDFLANAFIKKYEKATTMSFRYAEAMYEVSSLGMDWRIDALKDVKDIDAVKDLSDTFEVFWDGLLSYYKKLTLAISEKNPNSKTLGEITDIDATIRRPMGTADINTRDGNDKPRFDKFDLTKAAGLKYADEFNAMRTFWIKSGLVSEANYSDFFTSVIRTYAQDFEDGVSGGSLWNVIDNLQKMVAKRGVDYIRNLFTFDGNHDKPRVVHFAAMDMSLFHNDLSLYVKDNEGNRIYNINNNRWARERAMKIIFGVDDISKLPLEIKLNINNTDYFRTVSSQAVAMCNSLNDAIDDISNAENKKISDEVKISFNNVKSYFKDALKDLVEGRYLDFGLKINRDTIQDKNLQDIRSVITSIIDDAEKNHGLKIDDKTRKDWIEWVVGYATNDNLSEYSVQAGRHEVINERIDWLFADATSNPERKADREYSAYIVSLLAFTKEAFGSACEKNPEHMQAFTGAAIDFLNKYDQKYINEHSSDFPYYETYQNADRKNGFANLEFEETILMLIEQAEYLARQNGELAEGEHFENSDLILEALYKSIHEPAMAKSIGMAAMLAGLVGIATEYAGGARGQTGGEWKNNNVHNQNRNAIQRMKFKMLEDYRDEIEKAYNSARNVRNVEGAEALNIGTPYMLHFKDHIGAWLMQSKDSMTITIMTGNGINNAYRGKRNENFEDVLNNIEFPEGLLIEAGTKFECITSKSIIRCIVEHFQKENNGKYFARLIPKDISEIKLNAHTAPNGVAIFKRVPVFRGKHLNQQYNITTPIYNTYNTQTSNSEGQNLSIMCK